MQRQVELPLNHVSGQVITDDELNTAMTELLMFYIRNTDNKSNFKSVQKTIEKKINRTIVNKVNDAIHSYLVRII